jgi:sarcosine oxidase subunit beta
VRAAIEELLPRLVHVPLPLVVEGVYDVTPDHQAILGRVRERVWVAAGFSGHGFMVAPAVGRIVAEAVLGEARDPLLDVLDAQRFEDGRLVPEPSVV